MPESESNFQREVLDRLKTIEVKMDSYGEVKNQVYQNQRDILTLQELKNDVSELKDRNKWLARTLAGSLIGVVVAVVCFAIKLGAM